MPNYSTNIPVLDRDTEMHPNTHIQTSRTKSFVEDPPRPMAFVQWLFGLVDPLLKSWQWQSEDYSPIRVERERWASLKCVTISDRQSDSRMGNFGQIQRKNSAVLSSSSLLSMLSAVSPTFVLELRKSADAWPFKAAVVLWTGEKAELRANPAKRINIETFMLGVLWWTMELLLISLRC